MTAAPPAKLTQWASGEEVGKGTSFKATTMNSLIGFGADCLDRVSEVITQNHPSSTICMTSEYSSHPFIWPLNRKPILMESF